MEHYWRRVLGPIVVGRTVLEDAALSRLGTRGQRPLQSPVRLNPGRPTSLKSGYTHTTNHYLVLLQV